MDWLIAMIGISFAKTGILGDGGSVFISCRHDVCCCNYFGLLGCDFTPPRLQVGQGLVGLTITSFLMAISTGQFYNVPIPLVVFLACVSCILPIFNIDNYLQGSLIELTNLGWLITQTI